MRRHHFRSSFVKQKFLMMILKWAFTGKESFDISPLKTASDSNDKNSGHVLYRRQVKTFRAHPTFHVLVDVVVLAAIPQKFGLDFLTLHKWYHYLRLCFPRPVATGWKVYPLFLSPKFCYTLKNCFKHITKTKVLPPLKYVLAPKP